VLYPDLVELEKAVQVCRRNAQADVSAQCHSITEYSSHGGHQPQMVYPHACDLTIPVEVVTVGINPRWTKHPNRAEESVPTGQLRGPSTFDAYIKTILSALPSGVGLAHLELVQCGTPTGREVQTLVEHCRMSFFDKALKVLRPTVIVTIGRYASEHVYWYCTHSGVAGIDWGRMRTRHATAEQAQFGEHCCRVVFVLQPGAGVSTPKRLEARDAIALAYSQ